MAEEIKFGIDYVFNKIHGKKRSQKGIFYIKYGPPGSGKADILEKVTEQLKRNTQSTVDIDVDDIVSRFPDYQEKRQQLLSDSLLTNFEKSKLTSELYWTTRKKADAISDSLLKTALSFGHDIGFETTGAKIDWTRDNVIPLARRESYSIFVVYPFVSTPSLISRIKTREETTGQKGADEDSVKKLSQVLKTTSLS